MFNIIFVLVLVLNFIGATLSILEFIFNDRLLKSLKARIKALEEKNK